MEIAVPDAELVIPIAARVVATDVVNTAVGFVVVVAPVNAVVVPVMVVHALAVAVKITVLASTYVLIVQVPVVYHV